MKPSLTHRTLEYPSHRSQSNRAPTFSADDVLADLDAADERLEFVNLWDDYAWDIYAAPIDVGLHAYRDSRHWAVVVEIVEFDFDVGNVATWLHLYGNCLTNGNEGCRFDDIHFRIDNPAEVSADRRCYRGGVPIIVRGTPLDVQPPAGEALSGIFRRLVPAYRDLLLADESELRQRIPADLPEVLRLRQWHHRLDSDQKPSEIQTFQQLAEVLATGDLTRYRPTEAPNTHWSNWVN